MHDKPPILARFQLNRSGFRLDVDLTLAGQGITVIQGPSGSGKTTLLRCIAGLEKTSTGFLQVNGTIWQDTTFNLPTHQRALGYVFQEDCLFEHLDAKNNILFGCKNRAEIPGELRPILQVLGIEHLLARKPAELSGGERQRIAIARALAVNPEILLMDEPLSALDVSRRNEILGLIEALQRLRSIPIIYVTHDPIEATRLADQLVCLSEGRLAEMTTAL